MRKIIFSLLLLTAVYAFGQDKDQVVSFLHENDDQRIKFNENIIFIEEFNFGIPGGENWLVVWEDQWRDVDHQYKTVLVFVYVVDIDSGEIKFRERVLTTSKRTEFLSYYRLPGVTVDGICQVGDFNGDGFDDVLSLLGGVGGGFFICGFPGGRETWYCNIHYGLVGDGEQSPVKFINFNGENGFKVYYYQYEVAGGPGWVSDPSPDNHKWLFYKWDERQQKFDIAGIVLEGDIELPWSAERNEMKETAEQSAIDTENQTEAVVETNAEKKSIPLWALIAIIGVFVAVSACTALFVVKRRK
jgi:hypothetical protein